MEPTKVPQLGQIVRVIRGRDSEKLAVIIGVVDQRYVQIADGSKRKFDDPKKKSLLHLQLLPAISPEVADSIRETGRVTNAKLRHVLTQAANQFTQDAQEKGE
ncbi:KOW domain-containing RNA-binding protein [Paenibacillus puerhi]|uniref:KOW domain-containing RNA-binding protein n=1 Tax=Paenibacillus puerhi TaxID=2692622 RepID=UPI00135C1871|nr:KOW domain-containing RNA-binding protein [Paenibacillus puerhi]